jgi:putative phosphoribosyl transferase
MSPIFLFLAQRLVAVTLWLGEQAQAAALDVIPGASHLFEEAGALEKVGKLAREWFGHAFTRS